MIRLRVPCLALLAVVALAVIRPAPAHAMNGWKTYIRMLTCRDVLAERDTVWMATGEAGLLRWLRSSSTFESVTREPRGLASNALTMLTFDRSGRLWVGTSGKGVSRLSADGQAWDLVNGFDGLPSDSVTVMRADGDTVWIGTTRGIALWNGHQVAGSVPDLGTTSPFRSNWVNGIIVLGDSLIVGTTDGVYVARLSENLGTWLSVDAGLDTTNITKLATNGTDVFALAGGVLYRLDRANATWVVRSPVSLVRNLFDRFDRVTASTHDSLCIYTNQGTGWSAIPGAPVSDSSPDGGLALGLDPDGQGFAVRAGLLYDQRGASWSYRASPGPAGNDHTNVISNGSEVWTLPYVHGVSRFDGTNWENFYPGCCGPNQTESFMNPIYSNTLEYDRSGHLWTSHWETGIERIDLRANPPVFKHAYSVWGYSKTDTISRHSDGWSSAVDSTGYVYIGGDTPDLGVLDPMGIDVYDTTGTWLINWKTTNAGLRSNQVRAISYDRVNGLLWAGFAGKGVGYFDINTIDSNPAANDGNDHLKLPSFQYITSLLAKDVFGVVAHNDSIWVLTASELLRLRGSDRSVRSTLDFLAQPSGSATHPLAIARDGTVWTASVEGAREFFPGGGHTDFTVDNSPLADNEVRSVAIDPVSGKVWFATANGLNVFDPHYTPPAPPPLPALHVTVFPNPVQMNAMGIGVQIKGNGTSYEGEVMDINGRIVRRFQAAGNGSVIWDGRDRDGLLVRSGIYFVHTRGGGHEATSRVVVLR